MISPGNRLVLGLLASFVVHGAAYGQDEASPATDCVLGPEIPLEGVSHGQFSGGMGVGLSGGRFALWGWRQNLGVYDLEGRELALLDLNGVLLNYENVLHVSEVDGRTFRIATDCLRSIDVDGRERCPTVVGRVRPFGTWARFGRTGAWWYLRDEHLTAEHGGGESTEILVPLLDERREYFEGCALGGPAELGASRVGRLAALCVSPAGDIALKTSLSYKEERADRLTIVSTRYEQDPVSFDVPGRWASSPSIALDTNHVYVAGNELLRISRDGSSARSFPITELEFDRPIWRVMTVEGKLLLLEMRSSRVFECRLPPG